VTRAVSTIAIPKFARDEQGRRALFAAGACEALAEDLKSVTAIPFFLSILSDVIGQLALDDDCRRAFVTAGVCDIFVEAFRSAEALSSAASGAEHKNLSVAMDKFSRTLNQFGFRS
jgi:hypothetical protein